MSPYNPAWLLTALTLLFVSGAAAHEPGTAELRFDPATGDLRTELDLGDLDYLLRLDLNRDGTVSSDEIGLARSRIESFVADSVTIDSCEADPTRSRTGLRRDSPPSIVTAFTVAHPITLGLSALGHISLPAGPVEILIAASAVIAAVLNLHRQPLLPTWVWAYVFGLIHGFGFAGALGELATSDGLHLTGLLAFNLGVEVGQLRVVAIALPVLGILGKLAPLRGRLAPAGSTLIAVLGLFWILERL